MADEEEDKEPPPGVVRVLISCDESGTHGGKYYGFGTLWMPWQRRGNFQQLVRGLRDRHKYRSEFKWNDVSNGVRPFYNDLVRTFFETSWLRFHCYVVEKGPVKSDFVNGDSLDKARRKQFTDLLVNKIRGVIRRNPGRALTFRVWVDPIASSYARADEAVHVISNNVLKKIFKEARPVDSVLTKNSKDTPSIQLCDVLLGAVVASWEGRVTSSAKLGLQSTIAEHLGWRDLRCDTWPGERKFNTWYRWSGPNEPRIPETRSVTLKYPLPRLLRR